MCVIFFLEQGLEWKRKTNKHNRRNLMSDQTKIFYLLNFESTDPSAHRTLFGVTWAVQGCGYAGVI